MTSPSRVSTHPSILSFDNANFGTIRAIEIDGEPWFIAADVARILGYRIAPHLLRLLPEDEKGIHIVDTLGGRQEGSIISEPGLYRAIFASRSERAEPFKRWVCHEVLPAIRRQGCYIAPGAVVGILPLELFRKAWRGKPNAACLGCQLWAKLEIKMRLTDWLAIRLKHFEPGEDFEWWDGDALLPRRTAELIAARSWSEGAQQLRRRWSDNLSDTADLVEGGAV